MRSLLGKAGVEVAIIDNNVSANSWAVVIRRPLLRRSVEAPWLSKRISISFLLISELVIEGHTFSEDEEPDNSHKWSYQRKEAHQI